MDKKIKKIIIIGVITQAIIFLYISYTTNAFKNKAEKDLEIKYKNEVTYKETQYSILGKKYIFTIDKAPEIEIETKYVLKINLNPLGKYLFDLGVKIIIKDNYKKEVIIYLLDKYINEKHIIDITEMNKFEATTLIYEAYKNIRDEGRNEYFIELPKGLNIKIEYQGEIKEILAEDLERINIISNMLDKLKLPLQ